MTPQFVGIQHSGEHRTSREGAQGGSTRVAQRQARLEPPKGKSGRTAFWVAGHTKRLARREAASTLPYLIGSRPEFETANSD